MWSRSSRSEGTFLRRLVVNVRIRVVWYSIALDQCDDGCSVPN